MFQRIQQYPLISAEGRVYRPRAYGNPRPEGIWDGWLVFFPADGGTAIASDRETTQPSFHALTGWASSLSEVYLAGALERALRIAEQPSILAELARAEYDALEAAEQREMASELKRASAQADDQIAASARADARNIRLERVATEETVAAIEETAANLEAAAHEQAATNARATAADAGRRRRKAKKEAK